MSFKDLWNRPDAFRGRRVTVQGRVERIFRQGPVGSFPALAEVWITSPAGDPFLRGRSPGERHRHFTGKRSRPGRPGHITELVPELGQTVRFTGTFLKMVRYAAGDGARLAPLVVGDQPPVPAQKAAKPNGAGFPRTDYGVSRGGHPDNRGGRWPTSLSNWVLGLILMALAAGALAWQHLRAPSRRTGISNEGRSTAAADLDHSLEFIEPRDES